MDSTDGGDNYFKKQVQEKTEIIRVAFSKLPDGPTEQCFDGIDGDAEVVGNFLILFFL